MGDRKNIGKKATNYQIINGTYWSKRPHTMIGEKKNSRRFN